MTATTQLPKLWIDPRNGGKITVVHQWESEGVDHVDYHLDLGDGLRRSNGLRLADFAELFEPLDAQAFLVEADRRHTEAVRDRFQARSDFRAAALDVEDDPLAVDKLDRHRDRLADLTEAERNVQRAGVLVDRAVALVAEEGQR